MKHKLISEKGSTPITVIIVLVLAVLGYFGYKTMNKVDGGDMVKEKDTPPSPVPTPLPESNGAMKKYMDGTYATEGQYEIPTKAKETIIVSVTLKDGVVTETTFKGSPVEKGSIANQGKFTAGFIAEVVGKPIDDINLVVVNGSSLTPKGFMDALSQIKVEAQKKV